MILNNSPLPVDGNYITDKSLSTVAFSAKDIRKIIENLDSSKAHGHDNLSTRMLKICGDSICVPLEIIFKQALLNGLFPSERKKWNIVPLNKRSDKQNIENYRPVSLLPICGRIFERLIFNEVFHYLSANNFISKNQYGFQPGGPCITQLLSITHEIFISFDNELEVKSVFLDISKAFDKVWHEGLIFKSKQNVSSGELLHILSDFLSNGKQRVVLNCQ